MLQYNVFSFHYSVDLSVGYRHKGSPNNGWIHSALIMVLFDISITIEMATHPLFVVLFNTIYGKGVAEES